MAHRISSKRFEEAIEAFQETLESFCEMMLPGGDGLAINEFAATCTTAKERVARGHRRLQRYEPCGGS
jgi:hypothetical protein